MFIISGNSQEYLNYLRNDMNLAYEYKYVASIDSIRGHRNITGKFIGTWYEREDIFQIIQMLAVVNVEKDQTPYETAWKIAESYQSKTKTP